MTVQERQEAVPCALTIPGNRRIPQTATEPSESARRAAMSEKPGPVPRPTVHAVPEEGRAVGGKAARHRLPLARHMTHEGAKDLPSPSAGPAVRYARRIPERVPVGRGRTGESLLRARTVKAAA